MDKRTDDQSPESNNKPLDQNYWKSLAELYNDPGLNAASSHEFKEGATEEFNPSKMSALSRRKFIGLLSASAALAGAGCSSYQDKGEIIPYTNKPEEITLGKATYYASTCNACSSACGTLIKTREGRPIKLDGNPDHPVSKGKLCVKGQASILSLYDPDRLQEPKIKAQSGSFIKTTWQNIDEKILGVLSSNQGKEIAVITPNVVSPTQLKLFNDFQKKFSSVKFYSYEQFNNDLKNSAFKKCYSKDIFPLIKWNKAKIIVSLEADFLGVEGNRVENARLFAEGRNINNLESFNRLYVVEGNLSLTGMNADYRFRLRPDAQFDFVMSLINEVLNSNLNQKVVEKGFAKGYSLSAFASKYSLELEKLKLLVNDLLENKSKSIIFAGRALPENTQIAVNLLNEILGNNELYDFSNSALSDYNSSIFGNIKDLFTSMKNGAVKAVIHYGTNPVYNLPADVEYTNLLKNVNSVITFAELENETTEISDFVLPANHQLESWGDAKVRNGIFSLQQPVIYPLFNTRQKEQTFLHWISGEKQFNEKNYHEYLKNYWLENVYPVVKSPLSFDKFWLGALHDGVITVNENTNSTAVFNKSVLSELVENSNSVSGFAVMLTESYALGDGAFANNGWLQELPHPVSKVTWDNYASVSPATAKKLNLNTGDVVKISTENRSIKIPVFIQPGSSDNTITIEVGYGRSKAGVVGSNVGHNANLLMSKSSKLSSWLFTSASVEKTGETYQIVSAQEHYNFDKSLLKDLPKKRGIIREGTLNEYKKNPSFLKEEQEEEHLKSLYPEIEYTGVKWGMSIDLNKCLGCSECIVSCNSENNIPMVGKDQVAKGREMHWLRIDTYFSGSPDNPTVSNQPMLCQQCDHAPCENVCPVAATTHSKDGLNQMVYNRCVGTRYCSNNCPYKVRRFNFFNFRDHFRDSYQESPVFDLIYNPEVTVRSRGVMEKCTFCIQRIAEAKADATREHRQLKGSDVKTACQVACPTNAIEFGDINDKDSEFYKYRNHELGYYVLEELNIKPNVTYLAKLRNTHSEDL